MLQFLKRIAAGRRPGFSCLLLTAVLLLLMSTSGETACIDDALQRVDRDTLLMKSTAAYRVLDDLGAIVFWFPLSPVTICDQIDDAGDVYYEIRNHDQNQMVAAVRER